jgi:hypothetical protein
MAFPRSVAEIKELYPSWLVKASEKVYDRFLPGGVGVRKSAESEVDRILEGAINREGSLPPGLEPNVSPNSPRDIAKYNKQKIAEEHLRRMFAADRLLEEKKELHPSKRTAPRQSKDELPIRGVLAEPTEKPQPLEVSIPRAREKNPKQDVLEIPKEVQPVQEDITIRAAKFAVR